MNDQVHRGELTKFQATIAIAVCMKDRDNKPVNQQHMPDTRSSDISRYRLMGKQGLAPA